MYTDEQLRKMSYERGFLTAKTIRPAHHIKAIGRCPTVLIPEEAQIVVKGGNIYYVNKDSNYSTNFKDTTDGDKTWAAYIYYHGDWAEVVSSYRPTTYIPTTDSHKKLSAFPEEGVCWEHDVKLYEYLKARPGTADTSASRYHPEKKGLAWSKNAIWYVEQTSGKTPYYLDQLKPFFITVELFASKGYTSKDLVVGEYYYCEWEGYFAIIKNLGASDQERVAGPRVSHTPEGEFKNGLYIKNRKLRLATQEEKSWLDACIRNNKYIDKEMAYTVAVPDHVKDYPLTPEECTPNEYKWCIMVNKENECLLQEFMERKSYMWYHYTKDWKVSAGKDINYFHFPPAGQAPCHSHPRVQEGYSMVSTEYLKKHVLTNNQLKLNQDGKSETIKVQGPDISIRPGATIREIGIRCSKIKIEVRDGDCPNEVRSIRG